MRSASRALMACALVVLSACGSSPSQPDTGGRGGTSMTGGTGAGTGGTGPGTGGTGAVPPECAPPRAEADLLAEAQAALDAAAAGRRALWSALFGLQPDGTLAPGGLDSIDWDPSHDSVTFTSLDVERNVPILVANDAGGGPSKHAVLGIAADTGAHRYAVLGANPLADLAHAPPAAGSDAAKMQAFLVRLLGWLQGKDPGDGAGMKVVLAHLADGYWFRHDDGTAKFFADNLPGASVDAEDACEGAALAGCLGGATLLVISDDDGSGDDDHPEPADPDVVLAAVDAAAAQGIPALYVQYDGGLTPLGERLMARFRVSTTDNYWDRERLLGFSPTTLPAEPDALRDLGRVVGTLSTGALTSADVSPCVGQVSRLDECEAPGWVDKLGRGAAALRATLNGLDEAGQNPYAEDGFRLVRTLGLLGEVYRGQIAYPVDVAGSPGAFARAVVADASVHYAQRCARAQPDLGTFVCPRSDVLTHTCAPYDPAAAPRAAATVKEPFRAESEWTSTGLYAVPGVPFTVTRTDATDAGVSVRLAFQRAGTSRPFEVDGGGASRYDRPVYLASPWIRVAAGSALTLTSPHGGPIYVRLEGSAQVAGEAAELSFTEVGRHAALLDVGDDAAVASFVAGASANPFPHVDLRGAGFEVHLRKDRLLEGVTAAYDVATRGDGSQVMVDYHGDLGLLLADLRDHFVAPEYRLAGLAPPGSTLDDALDDDVKGVCAHLGWACTDASIHARPRTQHANYDQYANCGSGCSGNPFDADWAITPLGWGESHELGHDLQVGLLNVAYVPEAGRDDWSQYQGRAGENSNNVFPYHNLWRWLRQVRGEAGVVRDGHMNMKTLFAMVQSARAGLTRTVNGAPRLVVFDEACVRRGDYAPGTADVHAEAIWKDGGYAAVNGPRMAFYLQLPLRLEGRTMSEGTTLRDGFDLFPLLYAQTRLFQRAAGDDAAWLAGRDALGFGLFPRAGHPTYAGGGVDAMPGNDFLLVALSFLSGLDFRPYFRDTGVRWSALAGAQVDAHLASGRITGAVPSALSVLEDDLPGVDLETVATVAADGVATWPRDGFHPSSCP